MIRVGVIGTGGMANAHAEAAKKIDGVKLVSCCDVLQDTAEKYAAKHEIPKVYTDFREMLDKEELDAVTNVTPDAVHCDVAVEVLNRGVNLLSEKPLATTLDEAKQMAEAARNAGVINMVNFSYRNSSALHRAAEAIKEGKIGRIIHVESSYLQSWLCSAGWGEWYKNPGMMWRLSTKHGSAGVLGDLGCHIYDLTSLLCGDIDEIFCKLATYDKGVPGNKYGEYEFDANDSFVSHCSFKNGAVGTVHSSRWATGHANSLRCRVYGDKGAIEIDLDTSYSHYKMCSGKENVDSFTWKPIECAATPNMWERFVNSIKSGVNDPSDFDNGLKIQAYLHYSFASDAARVPMKVEY